jgi:hypothetical protein
MTIDCEGTLSLPGQAVLGRSTLNEMKHDLEYVGQEWTDGLMRMSLMVI